MTDETTEVVALISEGKLPKDFWSLGDFEGGEGLKDLHNALVQQLQVEAPDADTLELMMMERVCFLYIYMRAKEQGNAAEVTNFTRAYKDMLSLWVGMAADLRKTRMRQEEMSSMRMAIVTEIGRVLKSALKDVDPAISAKVQTSLVSLVAV